MRLPAHPGFLLVATRELRWIVRDRIALFLMIGVPLIAFTVLGITFSSAVIRGLHRGGRCDQPTSQIMVQAVAAVSGHFPSRRADDLSAAMGDPVRRTAAVYVLRISSGTDGGPAAPARSSTTRSS